MSETKTHYRKVFKSDHLGVADLEDFQEQGTDLIFTIAYVRQETNAKVAGRKIDANIAYFKEKIKPLVLNAGNSKVMRMITDSSFVEDWQDIPVQLYIDPSAKLKGEIVGGVRVMNRIIKKTKPELTIDNVKMWDGAKKAFIRDGNFNKVLERVTISKENMDLIAEQALNA